MEFINSGLGRDRPRDPVVVSGQHHDALDAIGADSLATFTLACASRA